VQLHLAGRLLTDHLHLHAERHRADLAGLELVGDSLHRGHGDHDDRPDLGLLLVAQGEALVELAHDPVHAILAARDLGQTLFHHGLHAARGVLRHRGRIRNGRRHGHEDKAKQRQPR